MKHLMPDTAEVRKYSTSDEYGEADYEDSGTEYICRYVDVDSEVGIDVYGNEVLITGIFYFLPEVDIDREDKIIYLEEEYKIIRTENPKGYSKKKYIAAFVTAVKGKAVGS